MKTNYTLIGDVREKLKELPDKSIQMCVTSPPYYALRDYGTAEWEGGDTNCNHLEKTSGMSNKNTLGHSGNLPSTNQANLSGKIQYKNECKKCNAKRKDNQLGLEKTPEEFVANLVEVFAQVHRVLRDDGTLWLNLGDSYLKDKQLGFIPQKVAIALQEWGWILRQDIIWAKKNCMPESVKDRFTKSHEYIFLLSKQPKYFFNQVLEPVKQESIARSKRKYTPRNITKDKTTIEKTKSYGKRFVPEMRNKRSVWNMRTASYKEAHFAVFPPELAETCIKAGCPEKICAECGTPYEKVVERKKLNIKIEKSESERFSVNLKNNHRKIGGQYDKELKKNPLIDKGLQKQCDCETDETKAGIVLDCFMGSGTTAMVAQQHSRKWIGVELNPEYEKLIKKRTAQRELF